MPDLWPAEFGTAEVKPPVAILREQAEYLSKKTGGLVLGSVQTSRDGERFAHHFYLIAPTLDSYTYHLFSVKHPVELYPLDLFAYAVRRDWPNLLDETAFNKVLAEVLNAEETRKIIRSLLAQTQASK